MKTYTPPIPGQEANYAAQAKYDQIDPLLSPRWRWKRARSLAQQGRQPSSEHHDEWIWRAWDYVRERRGLDRPKAVDSEKWFDAIHAALKIRFRRDFDTAILEARLLACEDHNEIGDRSEMPSAVIEAFAKLFFDVESRYEIKSWIRCQAIRYPTDFRPPTLGAVLRKFAYFAGADFLEKLIPHVRSFAANPSQSEPQDLDTEAGRIAASFRRILLLEMAPYNEKTAVAFMKLHVAMILQANRDADINADFEVDKHLMLDGVDQVLLEMFSEKDLERIRSVA